MIIAYTGQKSLTVLIENVALVLGNALNSTALHTWGDSVETLPTSHGIRANQRTIRGKLNQPIAILFGTGQHTG